MHAVVVRVTINDLEPATEILNDQVVPMASGAPGFVTGYWSQAEDKSNGMGFIVCENEEAAYALADQVGQGPETDAVTLEGVEVREVVANA